MLSDKQWKNSKTLNLIKQKVMFIPKIVAICNQGINPIV